MAEVVFKGRGDYSALKSGLEGSGHRLTHLDAGGGHAYITVHGKSTWQLGVMHLVDGRPKSLELNESVPDEDQSAHLAEVGRLAELVKTHYPRSVRR
ncbi:hypothetical protein AUJ14_01015 [Candidatus Micrarchaeota archaeon CG1_02_55_22]|nr:MAG: hypothetical protein AUJ14_01015 [Candidatus Micrarchaeota archaeon CG1_02_55_22]